MTTNTITTEPSPGQEPQQPPGRTGMTWADIIRGLSDVLADESEDAEHRRRTGGTAMTLPADIARCRGFGDGPEDWLDECETCQRRTAAGGEVFMEPPSIIAFFCEFVIPGDES